jgi:tRNA threonylcarbamoyladenosine biosynthesis protein TsaB
MYLFIDTTFSCHLGLWDHDKMSWLEYITLPEGIKASQAIHQSINHVLTSHQLEVASLAGVIYLAGPGSYTGVRLAVGIADILKWNNISTYSFYHYSIPQLLGVLKGKWWTNAFKNENFIYEWSEENSGNCQLVNSKDDILGEHIYTIQDTQELIYKQADIIFDYIIKNNTNSDIHYFRSENEEFKVSRK